MGQLSIRVLGIPEVCHEGRTLKFRSRKVLALLLYLAIEGRKVTREKISNMLWPESEEGAARATLRRALADLRDALDDSLTHTHLIIERDALGFTFTCGNELDIRVVNVAFDLLCYPRTTIEQDATQQGILHQLQQAMQVTHGNFMEGFSLNNAPDFNAWVDEHRAVWQRRMSLIYERLAGLQSEQGNSPGAIETACRWLAHDPFHEPAYQCLMVQYLSSSNYRAALCVYERCCKVLAEELCICPLPETQALAERIRHAANTQARSITN
jgi:DNA-binding SARP family transcriptional activator